MKALKGTRVDLIDCDSFRKPLFIIVMDYMLIAILHPGSLLVRSEDREFDWVDKDLYAHANFFWITEKIILLF